MPDSLYGSLAARSVRARLAEKRAEEERANPLLKSTAKPKAAKPAGLAGKAKAAPPVTEAKEARAEGVRVGFATGRDIERDRVRKVAAMVHERGGAAEALDLLARSDLEAEAIITRIKSRNVLADAM
ncbi:MAG: hypothetical protein V2I39_11655, partial [Erythrobacter sp.]|nr:hypothetical protein [Erythrobacter sp.]